MPGPTSHSYVSQRLRLHYLDWGNPEAPPLLMIHGHHDHAHNWDWAAERLQDRYHIIAPDLRGHGDSQWSAGSGYAHAEYVYDIAQLVHQRQLAPLRIVAHSLGGNVAMRYAGTFPEDVERLVVIEGWGGLHPRPAVPARLRSWVENQRSLAARPPRRYASLDEAFHRMLEANPHLSEAQARHLTIHGANQNEDGTYTWKFDNYTHTGQELDLPAEDVRSLWRNIRCPVLLIAGSESWLRAGIAAESLLADFGDARFELVEEAGHWVQHDQLDTFLGLVEDFLA
jgi:pimeloyl-ACP methyl ester carboxylesterase